MANTTKRILIVSDTHRQNDNFFRLLDMYEPFDLVIHCGDVEGDEEYIRQTAGCDCVFVKGNNDFFSDLSGSECFILEGSRVMVTHGHMYGVSLNTAMLEEEARSRGVQIVVFGHTHRPYLEEKDGLILMNPGSVSYPRQPGRQPGYAVMEIRKNQQPQITQKYLEQL